MKLCLIEKILAKLFILINYNIKCNISRYKAVYTGEINGENKEEKDIKLLLIYSDKDDLNQSINNIENWFKARLDLENIKVIIQKN